MIAAGREAGAIEVTDGILAKDEFEWRAHWYAGKALLALANKSADDAVGLAIKSRGRFDRVYFEMPGELAPRLGLGFAAELAGDAQAAELYYNRVATIDPAIAAAVFGLARCRLKLGDAAGAAQAIDALPTSHSMYAESRFALARAYMAADPAKSPDALSKASEVLTAIKSDSSTLNEIAAELLARTISLLEARQIPANPTQKMLDAPLTARALRLEAARRYRLVGRQAASAADKARWIDMSNAIRPLTLF
jgi:serine/threonine-protein kinase PknG